MSNQLYLNPYQKYFAHLGLNDYIMSGDQVVNGNGQATVAINTASLVQGPDLVTFTPLGVYTVVSAGMYTINPVLSIQCLDSAKDLNYKTYIRINRATAPGTNIDVGIVSSRSPNTGATNPNYLWSISTQFTGYFNVGDQFSIRHENRDTTAGNTNTILAANTKLWVTKLY